MTVARTDAAGGGGLLPEVLAFSSSLPLDRGLLKEDLVGSLAHLTMLSRTAIIPRDGALALRAELLKLWTLPPAQLPEEEDVHMSVEALLTDRLGEVAGLLHTARSRNDQVALDLRLRVREQCALGLEELSALLRSLAESAREAQQTLLPSYTHRQRAQPISLAYLLCAYGMMFVRDVEALQFVLHQTDALPLGVGAIAGTSLPIDRAITQRLLRFSRLTANGLDTVGDRDFALDFAYAASRCLLHASRVATDMIDFTTAEFGLAELDASISCGSSMMPQKKNPDLFELIRGKSGRAVGNLTGLLTTLKGLPAGYNRDLQEDRQPLLETGPLLTSVLQMLRLGLEKTRFSKERGEATLVAGSTQATDVAEALTLTGVPFRAAYQAVGKLVRRCQELKISLAEAPLAIAQQVDPRFSAEVLQALDPRTSVARKRNVGGTGPESVREQIAVLAAQAERAREAAAQVPRLAQLFEELKGAAL